MSFAKRFSVLCAYIFIGARWNSGDQISGPWKESGPLPKGAPGPSRCDIQCARLMNEFSARYSMFRRRSAFVLFCWRRNVRNRTRPGTKAGKAPRIQLPHSEYLGSAGSVCLVAWSSQRSAHALHASVAKLFGTPAGRRW